jgi:hypothetical protein
LTARIFENRNIALKPTLFFDIEIPVEPFELDGETQETAVRLDFIQFDVTDWRRLSGRTFRFPPSPTPGFIDGSLYLANAHNPADVTTIRCGTVENKVLKAEIDIQFDFTYEGPEEMGVIAVLWPVELALDPSQLDGVFCGRQKAGHLVA